MLSRSRCVSRAFSRSLSAFQKVLSGGAGVPAGSEAGCGRTGGLKGRGAGQAGHQGHRDAEAADALGAAPPRVPSPATLGVSQAAYAGRFLLSGTLSSGAGCRARRDFDSELAWGHGPHRIPRPVFLKTSACQSRGEIDMVGRLGVLHLPSEL